MDDFLYKEYDTLRKHNHITPIPKYIAANLNPNFELRSYQQHAFENFVTHFENRDRPKTAQVLFHMATGSGKTLIMAGLMLYLYKQGYRNFLFFVNLTNIVDKTRDNFLNPASSKYLFADEINIDGERITINEVENFQYTDNNAINICFATTQGLHMNMWMPKENDMTFEDFDDKKIVLISDEAHHLNVDTRSKRTADEEASYHSWEQTVKNIFDRNPDNILLEFTATCDLNNAAIRAEYTDKIIFDYPLAKFYSDKYSKDIITLRGDLNAMNRALQALILSQYRLKVFQDNRLSIKPVVLFKSAKIADSKNFMAEFIDAITNLDGDNLRELSRKCDVDIMRRAFKYFADNEISFDELAAELREDFSKQHCISVNDDKEADTRQLLLNSLEDADNPYRAIFEVKKLDEGWDVLNLFDIVRLYETRQSGKKISPATIAEAQLIGRGARYCPFRIDEEQPKFQRKYDNDADCELRICETLYYHCQNDHRYVSELRKALQEIGLDTDKIIRREYILKDSFKADDLYKSGLIFLNDRAEQSRADVHGLMPAVKNRVYHYRAEINNADAETIMIDGIGTGEIALRTARMSIGEIAEINYAIVNKALRRYPIYKFDVLRKYFPNIKTTREFIIDDEYLGGIRIDIKSYDAVPSTRTLYAAVRAVIGEIAESVADIEVRYTGTKEFHAENIRDVFHDKAVNYSRMIDGSIGEPQGNLSAEDWFAYTENYGTSEEKALVAHFRDYVDDLRKVYGKIYLIRNEREVGIYNFEDGQRFEPDYVLFLQKDATHGVEQWQIFIEAKGAHLLAKDAWKEQFLLRLEAEAIPVKIFADDNEYKIWGFHFYNREDTQDFDADVDGLIQ